MSIGTKHADFAVKGITCKRQPTPHHDRPISKQSCEASGEKAMLSTHPALVSGPAVRERRSPEQVMQLGKHAAICQKTAQLTPLFASPHGRRDILADRTSSIKQIG
jgi:hypothetical protein